MTAVGTGDSVTSADGKDVRHRHEPDMLDRRDRRAALWTSGPFLSIGRHF